jgi:hypothetical protein
MTTIHSVAKELILDLRAYASVAFTFKKHV